MTKDELHIGLNNATGPKLIKHINNRDIALYPISIQFEDGFTRINGIWYSIVMGDMMGDSHGNPLREEVKIKDNDLAGWSFYEPKQA